MKRPTPAFVVSMLALFVALSGTAVAGTALINGAQIKNHTIGLSKLTPLAVAQLRGRAGPEGPAGSAGPAGPSGGFDPNKVTYWAGAATDVPPGAVVTLTAACPAGSKAVGGGGFTSISKVGAAGPLASGAGWFEIVYNDTSVDVPNAQAFAVCVSP